MSHCGTVRYSTVQYRYTCLLCWSYVTLRYGAVRSAVLVLCPVLYYLLDGHIYSQHHGLSGASILSHMFDSDWVIFLLISYTFFFQVSQSPIPPPPYIPLLGAPIEDAARKHC